MQLSADAYDEGNHDHCCGGGPSIGLESCDAKKGDIAGVNPAMAPIFPAENSSSCHFFAHCLALKPSAMPDFIIWDVRQSHFCVSIDKLDPALPCLNLLTSK